MNTELKQIIKKTAIRYSIWLAFAFIFIIVMGFASAEVLTLPPVKLNQCINLPQQSATATYEKISYIEKPNTNGARINEYLEANMNKNGSYYNYTYCNNTVQGHYIVNGYSDGEIPAWAYDYEVTYSGYNQTVSQGLSSLGVLLSFILLTCIIGFIGFKLIEHDTLWILGLLFMILALMLLVFDVWMGYSYSVNYSGAINESPIIETVFYIFLFMIVAGFIGAFIYLFINYKKTLQKLKIGRLELHEGHEDE